MHGRATTAHLMARSIFITGATGFLGRHLLNNVRGRGFERVACLVRDRQGHGDVFPGVEVIGGRLADVDQYGPALRGVDTVIHLASVTGKAAPDEYFRTNVEGTRALLEACRSAGVTRLVYVSSIAVTYADVNRYYYAQSKRQAERLVQQSGLRYKIVRPTMILGPGSPVLAGLQRLAKRPVVPVFGTGETRVQPIDVDDLAELLLSIAMDEDLDGLTLEVGGPEVVRIDELLIKIRTVCYGGRPYVVHLPIKIVLPVLGAAETIAYSILPFTVGQLASFRFNGTARINPLLKQQMGRLKRTDQMLAASSTDRAKRVEERLQHECNVFSTYLSGMPPAPYVAVKYREAHERMAVLRARDSFEQLLVNTAAIHPILTRMADSYARLLAPTSILRKKLVLLFALLESSAASERFLDSVDDVNKVSLALRFVAHSLFFLFGCAVSMIFLLPCRAILGRNTKIAEEQGCNR